MRLIAAFTSSSIRPIAAAALLAIAAGVHAQIYPAKPVRLIVPFAPGGGTDIMARTLGQKLSELWGQQVIVDNRGGGGTIIGTELAVRSPPDGYTVMLANIALALNPGLHAKLPYDPLRDFAPVSMVATAPHILVTHPSLPVKTVQDVIALAKAKPG